MRYVVKEGMTFGAAGKYGPGDEVELPEEHAKPFFDKLRPVEPEPELVVAESEGNTSALSPSLAARLVAAGVDESELSTMPDFEILKIPGIGKTALMNIREVYPWQA